MASDRLPWFPCYPSKLLGALSAMKPDEGYLYWIVCLRIYEVGGPCLDTLDALARRTGLNKRRVTDALDRLFRSGKLTRQGEGIMNPFAEEILAGSTALHEERVRAGREGGLKASEKRKENQTTPPSRATASVQPKGTHLHLQKDSRVPRGTLASNDLFQKPEEAKEPRPTVLDPQADLYRRGEEVLGKKCGGMVTNLLRAYGGSVPKSRAALERASEAHNSREFVAGIIRGGRNGSRNGFAALARRLHDQNRMTEEDDGERDDVGGTAIPDHVERGGDQTSQRGADRRLR